MPKTKQPKKETPEAKAADIDAELRAAEDGLEEGPDLKFHPYLTAQAFAIERRDYKNNYLRMVTGARIRRKMGDHARAEELFKEAQRCRDAIVAIHDMVDEQPADVQHHFKRILSDWDQQLKEQVEEQEKVKKAA